jgi:hypothetical protein
MHGSFLLRGVIEANVAHMIPVLKKTKGAAASFAGRAQGASHAA